MKSAVTVIGLAAMLALATTSGAQTATDPVEELLSALDYTPDRASLDEASGSDAETDLLTLASEAGGADPGIRIRALHALAEYPSTASRTLLEDTIAIHTSTGGVGTLYLRAAMPSLALVARSGAVDTLAQELTHPSRDVRAAAARALAMTEAASAVPILRDRLDVEPTLQVRLAISAAIRELTGIPLP